MLHIIKVKRMKKFIGLVGAMLAGTGMAQAQGMLDVLRETSLQEVLVTSLRASSTTPVAFSNLNREQIEAANNGQDIIAFLVQFVFFIFTHMHIFKLILIMP